jgi:hypothetical protein
LGQTVFGQVERLERQTAASEVGGREPEIRHVLKIVGREVEYEEAAQTAKGGGRDGPQIVVRKIEADQIVEAGERVRLDLHDHGGPV